jgi:metallo-beta-lactamase family protein
MRASAGFIVSNRPADLPTCRSSWIAAMAVDASEIFCKFKADHQLMHDECRRTCAVATYIRSVEDSKSLGDSAIPKIIISASGMATGGRVLHHLKRFVPYQKNTILFAGYQAEGTRGAAMTSGAKSVRIHGEGVPVAAESATSKLCRRTPMPMKSWHG